MNLLAYITWNISPEIFKLGPVSVRWYGLLFALGFIVGYQILQRIFIAEKKPQKDLEALTLTMIIGTVVGARLGHCFFYEPAHYLANPLEILMVWKGGLASHGAAFGIAIALIIYSRTRKNISLLWTIDRVLIGVALAAAFVRIGNFFNSEIIGKPADVAWSVVFSRIDLIPRHPSQLYEAISYIAIFIILFFIYKKYKAALPPGMIMGTFLTLLFGMRFILEFFKETQVDFEKTMSFDMGQYLSIPFILVGIFFLVRSLIKKQKK